MPIDWKSAENTERLLTCVYAWLQENGTTISHHRIAQFFGNGTTYDAVQGNFRKFKQRIEEVKIEAGVGVVGKEGGGGASVAASRRGRKGRKSEGAGVGNGNGNGVLTGRVAKKGMSGKRKAGVGKGEGEVVGGDEEVGGPVGGEDGV